MLIEAAVSSMTEAAPMRNTCDTFFSLSSSRIGLNARLAGLFALLAHVASQKCVQLPSKLVRSSDIGRGRREKIYNPII